ncbi:hypothetical protein Tco_0144233 [Tanacetum coccineum]
MRDQADAAKGTLLPLRMKVVPSEAVVDKDDETFVLVYDKALGVGDGVLEIKFSGVLNEHMNALRVATPMTYHT